MAYTPSNIRQFASTRETSNVIALAIFELATEGDEARLWMDPTDAEIEAISARAWQLADADVTVLHWGVEKLTR